MVSLKEAITEPNSLLVTLRMTAPLDQTIVPSTEWFTLNASSDGILSVGYGPNTFIVMDLDPIWRTRNDELVLSYVPPVELSEGIRAVVSSSATITEKRIAALKPISNYVVKRVTSNNLRTLATSYPTTTLTDNLAQSQRSPYVDDFVLAYGEREAVQLTNLEDASASTIHELKIERAVEDALAYVDNYIAQATAAGKRLISSNRRRTSLIIARYYLDSVRRRKDVTDDYERAIKELENSSTATGTISDDPADQPVGAGGILATHATPQVYNRETGKGLCGWEIFTKGRARNRGYFHE